jgi:hypothetical protein
VNKASNPTLSLHKPTSNSSSTTDFPISDLRRLNSPIQSPFWSNLAIRDRLYSRRTDQRSENTASSIVAWLRPHRKHSSYCRILLCCLATGRYVTIWTVRFRFRTPLWIWIFSRVSMMCCSTLYGKMPYSRPSMRSSKWFVVAEVNSESWIQAK